MSFKDEKSKMKMQSMEIQCVDGFVRMVQDDPVYMWNFRSCQNDFILISLAGLDKNKKGQHT